MSDYIKRQDVIDIIHKEIENTKSYIEHNTQINIKFAVEELPTLDEKEIIRKAFERVVERLAKTKMRYFLSIANTGSEIMDFAYENVGDALDKAIEILKEECGISE